MQVVVVVLVYVCEACDLLEILAVPKGCPSKIVWDAFHAQETVRAEYGPRWLHHTIEKFLIEFKDTLDSVYAQIHRHQDWYHEDHRDPDSEKTLEFCILLVLSINTEDPSVEDAIEHDHEDAEGRGHWTACPCLSEISL